MEDWIHAFLIMSQPLPTEQETVWATEQPPCFCNVQQHACWSTAGPTCCRYAVNVL